MIVKRELSYNMESSIEVHIPCSLSAPNSMASTSTKSASRAQPKKRRRTSWTEQHIISIMEKGVSRRQCSYCNTSWSSSTSTGTIAKHLLDKHCIHSTSQPHYSNIMIRPPRDTSKLFSSRTSGKQSDSSIGKYIITKMIPHVHDKSLGFKPFINDVLPPYELMPVCTWKQSLLHMYVVLRQIVIRFLSRQESRFAITFDGWSNSSSSKGFYPMTLHWVCIESGKPMSMLFDFLNVFPGDGVGKHYGQALFTRLKSFGISSRLFCTTFDGASDAHVASKELGRLLFDLHGIDILPLSHMLRCMVHTFQVGVKSALEVISPSTTKLRSTLVFIRSSKVCRAIFRKYSRSIYEQCEQEPPRVDVITEWKSTLVMYQEAIKLRDVLNCTITDSAIVGDFIDGLLTIEDWNHIQAMEQWLLLPTRIYNYLSGPKHHTLSIATLAFNGLLTHCHKYLGMDVESIESASAKATLQVQQEASAKCLQYLDKYQESLKSLPSRIAMFLDPRVPTHNNTNERNLDIEMVQNILEANYHIDDCVSATIDETPQGKHIEHVDFWEMLGVNENHHESTSSSKSEIEHFMKFPQAKIDADPLQWWFNNRFVLPRMYKMACDYVALPSSSMRLEEANFEANESFREGVRLHSCTFKAKMFIRSWMDVLHQANISLPKDFNEAYQNLDVDMEDIAMEDDIVDYMLSETRAQT